MAIGLRTLEDIMRDEKVNAKKAQSIQNAELIAFAAQRPVKSKEDKMRELREQFLKSQQPQEEAKVQPEHNKTAPPSPTPNTIPTIAPENQYVLEQETPKFVDPYKGRFIKTNYNLTKDSDKAPIYHNARSMVDDAFNVSNNYKPIPIGEQINMMPKPKDLGKEITKDSKGRFLKKNTSIPLDKVPSDALHRGDSNMADNMLKGLVMRNFATQTFPEAHTVSETEQSKTSRLKQEELVKWLAQGFVGKENEDDNSAIEYPDTNYTPPSFSKPGNLGSKKNTDTNINEKTLDLKALKGSKGNGGGSINTTLLRDISKTLKQIQKQLDNGAGSSGTLFGGLFGRGSSNWRHEQEHNEKRDRDFMKNGKHYEDDEEHEGGGSSGLFGGLLGRNGGGAAGSLLGRGAGAVGRGLMALPEMLMSAPVAGAGATLAGGAAFAGLLAPLVARGLGDAPKIKEREQQKDQTRKDESRGVEAVKKAPTALDKLVGDGHSEIDIEQFNKLPNDAAKEQYLQSFGIGKEEIDKVLRSPNPSAPHSAPGGVPNSTPNGVPTIPPTAGQSGTLGPNSSSSGGQSHPNGPPNSPPPNLPPGVTPGPDNYNKRLYTEQPSNNTQVYDPDTHTLQAVEQDTPRRHSLANGGRGLVSPGSGIIDPSQNIQPGTFNPMTTPSNRQSEQSEGSLMSERAPMPDMVGPGKTRGPLSGSGGEKPETYSKPGTEITGKTFAEKSPKVIENLMKDFKLTKEQAAGVVGNLGHESAGFKTLQEVNPVGGGKGGYGWAQWTGPRRKQFFDWAEKNHLDVNSDEANYGFLKHELSTSEKGAIDAVKKTNNAKDATVAFEGSFERAGVKSYASREKYTNQSLQAYELAQKDKDKDASNGTQLAAAQIPPNVPGAKSQPVPTQSESGGQLVASNDQNQGMASKVASKDTPPVVIQSPPQQTASAGPKSGGGNRDLPPVRNDDPAFLRALMSDIKQA